MKDDTVAQTGSAILPVAERYAGSLYELASDTKSVDAVEADLKAFSGLIADSADLKRLIESPAFSADDQFNAISALVEKAKAGPLVGNFLKLVARNRRLFALPAMITAFSRIAAEKRGEVTAEVVSAAALTAAQEKQLASTLKEIAGKDVTVSVTVDPSLLGGLVVRLGSRQIDTSLRTKLNSLKLALKEVG